MHKDLHVGSQGLRGHVFAYDKTQGAEVAYQLVKYGLDESGNLKFEVSYTEFAKLDLEKDVVDSMVDAAAVAAREFRPSFR